MPQGSQNRRSRGTRFEYRVPTANGSIFLYCCRNLPIPQRTQDEELIQDNEALRKEIGFGRGFISFGDITEAFSGEYACKASNVLGVEKRILHVQVEDSGRSQCRLRLDRLLQAKLNESLMTALQDLYIYDCFKISAVLSTPWAIVIALLGILVVILSIAISYKCYRERVSDHSYVRWNNHSTSIWIWVSHLNFVPL
jgi:hypothetical protein